MTKFITISILITLFAACKFEKKAKPSVVSNSIDRIEKLDTISTSQINTVNQKTLIVENESSNKDTTDCKIESYFSNIELPLKIDYEFLISFNRKIKKTQIPYECIGDGTVEYYHELPVSVNYAYGKITLTDSIDLYLVITGPNPDNPLDMAFISASILTKDLDKLGNKTQIAKYHYYSRITEAYYCTIDKNSLIQQNYKHTGEYEGKKDIFKQGDTTYTLVEIWNKNLR